MIAIAGAANVRLALANAPHVAETDDRNALLGCPSDRNVAETVS
jgi:hypothetical protein